MAVKKTEHNTVKVYARFVAPISSSKIEKYLLRYMMFRVAME